MSGQAEHAFFLSLAALLGDNIFNFGELLAHEVSPLPSLLLISLPLLFLLSLQT